MAKWGAPRARCGLDARELGAELNCSRWCNALQSEGIGVALLADTRHSRSAALADQHMRELVCEHELGPVVMQVFRNPDRASM